VESTDFRGQDPAEQLSALRRVAFRFTGSVVGDVVHAADYPTLSAFSARAEALPEFLALPLD